MTLLMTTLSMSLLTCGNPAKAGVAWILSPKSRAGTTITKLSESSVEGPIF